MTGCASARARLHTKHNLPFVPHIIFRQTELFSISWPPPLLLLLSPRSLKYLLCHTLPGLPFDCKSSCLNAINTKDRERNKPIHNLIKSGWFCFRFVLFYFWSTSIAVNCLKRNESIVRTEWVNCLEIGISPIDTKSNRKHTLAPIKKNQTKQIHWILIISKYESLKTLLCLNNWPF